MKIRALVVEAKDAPFEVQEPELADPGRGEALVRIAASGVCHTGRHHESRRYADAVPGKVIKPILRMPQ